MLNSADTSDFFQNNHFFEKNYKSLGLVLVNGKMKFLDEDWGETFCSVPVGDFIWLNSLYGLTFRMERNPFNGEAF